MMTDREDDLYLTRLNAADLACIAGLRRTWGDEAAERVSEGLRTAASCRRQAELREAQARARRAVWVGMRRHLRQWSHRASRPVVAPWARRLGGRLRQTISSFAQLA